MKSSEAYLRWGAMAWFCLLPCIPAAHAGTISYVDIFKNVDYLQTGDGNTLTANGAFFSAELISGAPGDYGSVILTYPGPASPLGLTELNPPSTDYKYQTTPFGTQAAMDTAFPFGAYAFLADGTDSASLNYAADDYAQTLPYLTGTDFSSLQGMNPANPFTVHFSTDTPGGSRDESDAFIFFTIYDQTLGQSVFDGGFLPATASSLTIPANTLNFGDTFSYEIDFSDRTTPFGNGGTFPPEAGFDIRTDGAFSSEQPASVPEPGSLLLSGLGLLALAAWKQRR